MPQPPLQQPNMEPTPDQISFLCQHVQPLGYVLHQHEDGTWSLIIAQTGQPSVAADHVPLDEVAEAVFSAL